VASVFSAPSNRTEPSSMARWMYVKTIRLPAAALRATERNTVSTTAGER
jgi:hypothetical protein